MNAQKKDKGFTIIEVVLVLAIAALIFLMIFIALPALQRGQRDTGRKNDANAVASAVNTWKSNHRGSLPSFSGPANDLQDFRDDYVKQLSQFGVNDVVRVTDAAQVNALTINQIGVLLGRQCHAEGDEQLGEPSSRAAAVYVKLEQSDAIVCTDA